MLSRDLFAPSASAASGLSSRRGVGLNREEKVRVIESLTAKLRVGSAVLVDYQGMDVARSTDLRRRSRESGVDFVVAKNTLTKRAADEAGVEGISEFLLGPTALAFSEDPVEELRDTFYPGLIRGRSEEHTSELQSQSNLVCRLLLEKKKKK